MHTEPSNTWKGCGHPALEGSPKWCGYEPHSIIWPAVWFLLRPVQLAMPMQQTFSSGQSSFCNFEGNAIVFSSFCIPLISLLNIVYSFRTPHRAPSPSTHRDQTDKRDTVLVSVSWDSYKCPDILFSDQKFVWVVYAYLILHEMFWAVISFLSLLVGLSGMTFTAETQNHPAFSWDSCLLLWVVQENSSNKYDLLMKDSPLRRETALRKWSFDPGRTSRKASLSLQAGR